MALPIELDKLTAEQKWDVFDALWADLSREAEVESPAWHGQVLAERRARIERGEAKYIPWDEVDKRLRETDEIPRWHADILAERDASEARGEAEYLDWDEAKRRIRGSIR